MPERSLKNQPSLQDTKNQRQDAYPSVSMEHQHLTLMQRSLISQSDFTPDVVRTLQRQHGNAFVQRLIKQAGPSATRTPAHAISAAPSSKTAKSATIQRRIPSLAVLQQDLGKLSPDAQIHTLKRLIEQTWYFIDETERTQLDSELQTREGYTSVAKVLEGKDKDGLMAVANWLSKQKATSHITHKPRSLTYKEDAADQSGSDAQIAKLYAEAKKFLAEAAAGQHDDQIKLVFPDAFAKARENFKAALTALEDAFTKKVIKSFEDPDFAGELGMGAVSGYKKSITLPPSHMDVDTLIHENMHYTSGAILDDGGYRNSPMFRTANSDLRLKNADHYALVYAIVKDPTQVSLLKVGDNETEKGDKTKMIEEARKAWAYSTTRTRTWRRIKEGMSGYETKREDMAVSKLVGATLHHRDTTVFGMSLIDSLPTPNQSDIAIMEGVTHALNLFGKHLEKSTEQTKPDGSLEDKLEAALPQNFKASGLSGKLITDFADKGKTLSQLIGDAVDNIINS